MRGRVEGSRGWQRVVQWTREVLECQSLKANIIMERSRTRRANGSRIQSGQSAWLAVSSVHTRRNSLNAKSWLTVVSHCQRRCLSGISHRIRAKKGNIHACLLSSRSLQKIKADLNTRYVLCEIRVKLIFSTFLSNTIKHVCLQIS